MPKTRNKQKRERKKERRTKEMDRLLKLAEEREESPPTLGISVSEKLGTKDKVGE